MDKNDPYGQSFFACYKKEANLVEAFIESENPEKKRDLQNFVKDLRNSMDIGNGTAPAFKKLEDVYKRDLYKQGKMAELRRRTSERANKMLAKVKLFGKGRD